MKEILDREGMLEVYCCIAEQLERKRDAIINILTEVETFRMAQIEVNKTIRALKTFSKEIPYIQDRLPLGKVAVFLPYNTPLYSLVLYAFGPLFAGNRVFVKPSSLSFDVTKRIIDLLIHPNWKLGLSIHEPGKWFLQDFCLKQEKVNAVSFTGQWGSVGKVYQQIPDNVRFIYSGSGYCPFIVLSDANIDDAVESAIFSRVWNSGQDCLASERFYIEENIFHEFSDLLLRRLKDVKCGDNSDPDVQIGPLISKDLVDYNVDLLNQSSPGSQFLLKGEIDSNKRFITPFVLVCEELSPITLAEKYAPIFPLVKISKRESISGIANSLDFALAATVYGEDKQLTDDLFFGHIAQNASILAIEDEDAHVPFGGYKNSGMVEHKSIGYRTSGPILYSVETTMTGVGKEVL